MYWLVFAVLQGGPIDRADTEYLNCLRSFLETIGPK
jgi:hypothetical protein